jgi:autotransporter-associated beta strand protein
VRLVEVFMRLDACVRAFALTFAVGLLVPGPARAQTYTWNQATSGGDWLSASNWLGGGPPNAAGTVAVFGDVATGANTIAIGTPGTVTVGELRFADVNNLTSAAAYTIATSSQTITFNNGASANLLTVTGSTTANQTVAATISVGTAQPFTINNGGAPAMTAAAGAPLPTAVSTLTLSGPINAAAAGTPLNVTGASTTTISGAIGGNFGTLTKSGSGVLVLSGSNSYTGGTVINGGTVLAMADAGLGATAGSVTLNGGAFRFGAVYTTGRNFALGTSGGTILSALGDGVSNNPQMNGVISGGSTSPLTFDGGGYVQMLGSNTYSGPTIINNAGVFLISDFTGPARGRLTNTSSITINGFVGGQVGFLDLQNILGADNNRVNPAAPIKLNGGILTLGAGVSGAVNQPLGGVTVNGFGSLFANQGGGSGTASATLASLSRSDNFSTLYVGGPVTGTSQPGISIQFLITGGGPPLSGSGTGNQVGIIPWIGGDNGSGGSPTAHANTFYSYGANGLFALDPTSGGNFQLIAAGGQFNGPTITLAKNNSLSGDPLALTANQTVTILSLALNPASTTASSTINGPASSTLTVSTGAIANVNPLTFNGPTLNFGANTGYMWLGSQLVVQGTSRITGSNGLVVSSNSEDGRNELVLVNTASPNAFTGGLYINGTARVQFDTADSQLGAAGQVISFRGGTLWYIGSGAATLATSGTNRPLQLTAAGGGIIRVETGGTLTVPGLVSGTEQLTATGAGTLVLANTANTYAGGTTVGDSTLVVAGLGSLGTGPLTLGVTIGSTTFSNGTLRFNSGGTLTASVLHAAPTTIDTNGNNVTFAGVVSGSGGTLTKAGAGTLTLAAANTYTANTTVSTGNLFVTNTTGSGTGYGSVTVNSGAALGGTGAVSGPVTVAAGGKLIVGPGTGPGTLTLRGGTTLNSTSTFQGVLAGSTAGTGYSQLVVASGGSINLGSATLSLTLSYTPSASDLLFLVNNQNATGGLSGTFNGLSQGAQITFPDGTKALISYQGDVTSLSFTGGNDVVLYNIQPVPEPGSVLGLAALALGGLAWRQRRRAAVRVA